MNQNTKLRGALGCRRFDANHIALVGVSVGTGADAPKMLDQSVGGWRTEFRLSLRGRELPRFLRTAPSGPAGMAPCHTNRIRSNRPAIA